MDPNHPNVVLAKRAVEAWNTDDIDRLVTFFAPDCTVESYLSQTTDPYRGHDGLREWKRDVHESFGRFDIDIQEGAGDARLVLLLGHVHVTGQSSGVPLVQEAGFVIELEAGLVARARAFGAHRDAREAAEEVEHRH